jgi:hypothetical protein
LANDFDKFASNSNLRAIPNGGSLNPFIF